MTSTDVTEQEIKSMKVEYEETMRQCYLNKSLSGPWTREWVQDIKKVIKTRSNLPLSQIDVCYKYIKDNYFVLDDKRTGQLMRVLKISPKGALVLPWEDAFDVIWESHLKSDHGDVTKTINILKKEYFIEIAWVRNIVSLCPICKKDTNSNNLNLQSVYNKRASMELLDMHITPDRSNKYVIIYTDEGTGLIQLKALTKIVNTEIALKLIEIFTDLGPPEILTVYDITLNTDSIISIINRIFFPCQIRIEFSVLTVSRADYVKNLIMEWMKNDNTTHWEMGCYVLQWKINNIIKEGKTPHQLVFECDNVIEAEGVHKEMRSIDEKGGPSHKVDVPTDYLDPKKHINLFNKPEISDINDEVIHENIYDSFITINDGPLKHDNDLEADAIKIRKLGHNSTSKKYKAYVNKKVLNRKQNNILVLKSDPDLRGTGVEDP